jgi:hypothetical protein
LLSPLTMYFFFSLLQTGAQALHGFTTAAASSGVVFLAWGIHGAVREQVQSWTLVVGVLVATLVMAVILRPFLLELKATERVVRDSSA